MNLSVQLSPAARAYGRVCRSVVFQVWAVYCGQAKHVRDTLYHSSYCFCYKTQWRLCSSTIAICCSMIGTGGMALKESEVLG